MRHFIIPALAVIGLCGVASAQNAQGDITITKAWARATASASTPGVIYFSATDSGAPDTLTAVSTPMAAKAQLHESRQENGVTKMRPIDDLPISKDKSIVLAPGGYHIMLTGLTQPLKAGQTFPLTLTFAHAGAVSTVVTVGQADSANGAKPEMDMKGMDMGGMDMSH